MTKASLTTEITPQSPCPAHNRADKHRRHKHAPNVDSAQKGGRTYGCENHLHLCKGTYIYGENTYFKGKIILF